MKKRRFAAGFLILCLLLGLLPAPALALEPAEKSTGEEVQLQAVSIPEEMSGLCGTNLTWTLSTDGVLTISGAGEMFDYSTSKLPEWNQYNMPSRRWYSAMTSPTSAAMRFTGCSSPAMTYTSLR